MEERSWVGQAGVWGETPAEIGPGPDLTESEASDLQAAAAEVNTVPQYYTLLGTYIQT